MAAGCAVVRGPRAANCLDRGHMPPISNQTVTTVTEYETSDFRFRFASFDIDNNKP